MKRLFVVSLLLVITGRLLMAEPLKLTVMTYNIRHGLGVDKVFDLNRIIKTIKYADPDILILNEVDQGNPRSGELKEAALIAEALGMNVFFSPTESRTDYGNAVLSKFPIEKAWGVELPQPRWMLAVKRGASVIITNIDGRKIMVIGAHLGLGGIQEVKTEISKTLDIYNEYKLPTLIAGDFNIEWFELSYGVPDMFKVFRSSNHAASIALSTFPSNNPGSQIDYILSSPEFQINDVYTIDSPASDHVPVIAEVVLP